MKTPLLILLFVLMLGNSVFAQVKSRKAVVSPASETLTNASIIELNKAGLGDEVIIAKIESSAVNFDLSANGLIALKTQKVDSEIIKAMMQKSSGKSVTAATAKSPLVPVTASNAIPDVKVINQVYLYNKAAGKATPLEKTIATLKFKKKMLGYGGMDVMYIADGTASPVRFSASEAASFLMNVPGTAPDMILYKLLVTEDSRQAITQKIKAMSTAAKADDNMVPFTMENVKPSIYQFNVSQPLQKGEYFFIVKPTASLTTVDAYAFGID